MDQERFDQMTRALASGQSRRGVLKGLVGSVLGGALAGMGLASGAAKPAKVGICHWDKDNGSYTYIEVSERAVRAHAAHGDMTHIDPETDESNCGACGKTCNPGESCVGGTCKCGTNDACNPNETCEVGTGSSAGFHICRCGEDDGDFFGCGRRGSCVAGICTCGGEEACDSGEVCSPFGGCGAEGQPNPT